VVWRWWRGNGGVAVRSCDGCGAAVVVVLVRGMWVVSKSWSDTRYAFYVCCVTCREAVLARM
jgi:hypothetical protein